MTIYRQEGLPPNTVNNYLNSNWKDVHTIEELRTMHTGWSYIFSQNDYRFISPCRRVIKIYKQDGNFRIFFYQNNNITIER